jgi:ABC-type Fe3+ transport system substrate-binding protein
VHAEVKQAACPRHGRRQRTLGLASLYKAKALDPIGPALMLAEVKDVSKWLDSKHHYNDIDNQYVCPRGLPVALTRVQPKISRPKKLTSYWDLLDPKWKGKITLKDPPRFALSSRVCSDQ